MKEEEIQAKLLGIVAILRPQEMKVHISPRTLEEDLEYLRTIAQYSMLDLEAQIREASQKEG